MKFKKTLLVSSMALALASTQSFAAFDAADTDYTNAKQSAHMWTPGMDALDNLNNILCFVEQLKAGEMVNKGLYTALVNEEKCETGSGDSRDKGPKQQFVIVESVRTSDTAPQKTKVWIPGMPMGDDMKGLVKAYASISDEPTAADPLQDFTLRFDMYDEAGTQKIGSGYIKATPSSELEGGKIGVEFYEESQFGAETYTSAAKLIKNPDGSDGLAITRAPSWDETNQTEVDKYYGLAWNETTESDRVKIQEGNSASNNSDLNGSEMCLAKDQLKTAVWQYGVYDKTTGEEVKLNSGFPISYGDNKHGYIGYWGFWTEDEETLPTTGVYKTDYSTEPPTKTEVSVSTAPGKLWKNQLKTLTMADIAGIEFEYGAWDGTSWQNYMIAYDDGTSQFEKVATFEWDDNGMEVTRLDTPLALVLDPDNRLFLWSNQLGGQVTISTNGSGVPTSVVIAERSLVTPNSTELSGGSLDLTCFDRCPKANISATDLNGDTVMLSNDFSSFNYTLNKTDMTLQHNSADVAFADGVTEEGIQGSNYQWGVQSGMLIPTADAAGISNFDALYNGTVDTWYEWETGLQNWNQYTMVSDASGNVITFDEPKKFELTFDAATMARNSASAQSASYDGQKLFLEYGGNGELWGFPNIDVGDGFYYPAIALKDGTALTLSGDDAANYVVKAWQMEQKMAEVNATECSALALGDVPGGIPTALDASLPVNTDSVPSVDDLEPSVINGVVQ